MSDQGNQKKRQRSSRQGRSEAEEQRAHEQEMAEVAEVAEVAETRAGESDASHEHSLQASKQGFRHILQEQEARPAVLMGTVVNDALRSQTQPDNTTPTEREQDIMDQYTVLQVILEKPVPIGGRNYEHEDVINPPFFKPNTQTDFAPFPPADWKPSIDPRLSAPPTVTPMTLDFGEVSGDDVVRTCTVIAGSAPLEIVSMEVIGPNADHFLPPTNDCPSSQIQPGDICTVEITSHHVSGWHSAVLAQLRVFVTTSREPLTVVLTGSEIG